MADGKRPSHGPAKQAPASPGKQAMTGLPAGDLKKKTFTSAATANDALSFTNLDVSGGAAQASAAPSSGKSDAKK